MKEKIEKYTRDVFSQRAKILDDFARAYLAERMGDNPNFKISDLELVEERSGNIEEFKTTFFFRIKRGRKRKLV